MIKYEITAIDEDTGEMIVRGNYLSLNSLEGDLYKIERAVKNSVEMRELEEENA